MAPPDSLSSSRVTESPAATTSGSTSSSMSGRVFCDWVAGLQAQSVSARVARIIRMLVSVLGFAIPRAEPVPYRRWVGRAGSVPQPAVGEDVLPDVLVDRR